MERELGSVSPPRTPLISPYDNLAAKQSHGLPLPCSVNDTSACITQEVADRIYRLRELGVCLSLTQLLAGTAL